MNLWWTWNPEAQSLFREIDENAWDESEHNPVMMLGRLSDDRVAEVASDDSLVGRINAVIEELDSYVLAGSPFAAAHSDVPDFRVAFFSLEFGLSESLPIYSGGLGVLAGDLLKTASDLGVPFVGMGLLYRDGYFRQLLDSDGRQHEIFARNDFYQLPVDPILDESGRQSLVRVDIGDEHVVVKAWNCKVGRARLILLDTQVPENSRRAREITSRLYGGDMESRIKQEIVLGIAGLRTLANLGISPTVCHVNEGHAALLTLEWIGMLKATRKLSFAEAREVAMAGTVFTTHTPVPAGHDRFARDLVEKYLSGQIDRLGVSTDELLALGNASGDVKDGDLDMTALALRLSGYRNGVSRLHGRVSRRMWQHLWPDVPAHEVSIDHVTNGVHPRSWISAEMARLYDRYLGPEWSTNPTDSSVWNQVHSIPDIDLRAVRARLRQEFISYVRRRLVAQLNARGASKAEVDSARQVLSPEALTIGFARRFASYKRADLVISDPDRLHRLLNDPQRPVQIVFAGKAHPRDEDGKEVMRRIFRLSRDPRFERRIVFLENYNMDVATHLVQGVDVWLNTPLRPQEASGTSGIKAALNGALNPSVLDGWWDEAYSPEIGWAIGNGIETEDSALGESTDAASLYTVLEDAVIPLFYNEPDNGSDDAWAERMKASIASIAPRFNTERMLGEYCDRFYLPAHRRAADLLDDNAARAKGLAWWKGHVSHHWNEIRIDRVEADVPGELARGDVVDVRAYVETGKIASQDLIAQIYEGPLDPLGEIQDPQIVDMERRSVGKDGLLEFAGRFRSTGSGRRGYTVRVLPSHSDMPDVMHLGRVRWA